MKCIMHFFLIVVMATGLSACGHRGGLKSPEQIKFEQEKEARKAAEKKTEKPATEGQQ